MVQVVVAFYVADNTEQATVKWCNDQGYSGVVQVREPGWSAAVLAAAGHTDGGRVQAVRESLYRRQTPHENG